MAADDIDIVAAPAEFDALEPLWIALHRHHRMTEAAVLCSSPLALAADDQQKRAPPRARLLLDTAKRECGRPGSATASAY